MRGLTPRQESLKLTLKQVSLPWAIYIRVSSKDQGEKYSPASQRKTLLRLAEEIGVSVPENFILLDTKSGRNEERPDYQRLLKLAKEKQIGGALVLELSRVGRNVPDSLAFRAMLKREGVVAAFALQQFDDSPQGKFMWTQFAAVAELEADMILQRTSKGRLEKAQQGQINDPHCFGYKYHLGVRLPGGKFQCGYIEEDPAEAYWVRWIFEQYAKRGSAFRIQMALNKEGILTKRGNPWCNPSLLKLLRNPIYTGVYITTVKGEDLIAVEVTMETPAIISKALFEKVQVMLAENGTRAGRPPTQNLLSGFIRCSRLLPSGKPCKRRWVCNVKLSFSCSNRYDDRTRTKLCRGPQISRSLMERLVIEGVRNRLREPETAYRLAKEYHAETACAKPEAISVEARLARLKQRYERAEGILFSDLPQRTRDKAAAQLKEMDRDRQALEVEARETAVVALPSRDRIVDTCEQMREGLDGLKTFDEKREFLLKTVERVETDGVEYAVYCRIELAPAARGQKGKLDHGLVNYFAFVIRGQVA
jgi:DNA invertase Pin-like site-specific DNA recombinase